MGVKPEKPDHVPTSQCHPVLELIASEISLTNFEDHFTKPRRKKLVGDGAHRPCVRLALEQLPVWTTEKDLLKTKQGRTLVSYLKWKCPGIKSCLGLD